VSYGENFRFAIAVFYPRLVKGGNSYEFPSCQTPVKWRSPKKDKCPHRGNAGRFDLFINRQKQIDKSGEINKKRNKPQFPLPVVFFKQKRMGN
jgi:hypothetical protein